jgi:tetratricopeptide (TPR) repeat protein
MDGVETPLASAGPSIQNNFSHATIHGHVVITIAQEASAFQARKFEEILSREMSKIAAAQANTSFNTVLSRLAESAVDLQASAMDLADRMQGIGSYIDTCALGDLTRFLGTRAVTFDLVIRFLQQRRMSSAHSGDASLAHAMGLAFEACLDLKSSRENFVQAIQLEPRSARYARTATESCLFTGLFAAAESHARHWHDLVKDDAGASSEIAEALNGIGSAVIEQGRLTQGVDILNEGVEFARRSDQPRLLSLMLNNLGAAFNLLDVCKRAEPLLREALDLRQAHWEPVKNLALTRNNLSATYRQLRKFDEAEEELLETMALLHRGLPVTAGGLLPPIYAQTLNNLGSLRLIEFEDPDSALGHFEKALQSLNRLEDWAPNVAITLHNIAYAHVKMGKPQQAAEYYRRAIRGATKLYGPEDDRTKYMVHEASRHCSTDSRH